MSKPNYDELDKILAITASHNRAGVERRWCIQNGLKYKNSKGILVDPTKAKFVNNVDSCWHFKENVVDLGGDIIHCNLCGKFGKQIQKDWIEWDK